MISNSTPLICLSKLNRLDFLKLLFRKVIITPGVQKELLIKEKDGFLLIEKAIKDKWIEVHAPKFNVDYFLGKGENEVINLAKEKNYKVIIDDLKAIRILENLNIDYIRTTTVILLSLKNKIINKFEAKRLIDKLIENGYYISMPVYTKLIDIINKEN
jgi:predicted nucleic acid-binding protein